MFLVASCWVACDGLASHPGESNVPSCFMLMKQGKPLVLWVTKLNQPKILNHILPVPSELTFGVQIEIYQSLYPPVKEKTTLISHNFSPQLYR